MKIYNKQEEKLYSTGDYELDCLLEKAFCEGYEYAQREFTKYDDTDDIKRAKDSDILAEKEKKNEGYGEVVGKGAKGALIGGVSAAALGALASLKGKKAIDPKQLAKLAAVGGALGGTVGVASGAKKRAEKQEDIDFYNKRLRYAKYQARRRERKDWKSNMTQREGYSY